MIHQRNNNYIALVIHAIFCLLTAHCRNGDSLHSSMSKASIPFADTTTFVFIMPDSLGNFQMEHGLLNESPMPIQGLLKIPRLAVNPEKQQQLSLQMQHDGKIALACAVVFAATGDERFRHKACDYLAAWSHIEEFADGGSFFWDFFIGRLAGDTPIVTFCQFSKFIVAAELCRYFADDFQAQVARAYRYALKYRPAQNNNHQSWKNLFLLLSSLYLRDGNYRHFLDELATCITTQIDYQGRMPLELRRGRKALTYTLMNLEALVYAAYLGRVLGYPLPEEKLKSAVDFFMLHFVNETAWRRQAGVRGDVNAPDSPDVWAWITVLPSRWWKTADWPGGQQWFNIEARRAYLLFYPQLFLCQTNRKAEMTCTL
ncbi:hypothetical protein EH223_05690 [candidate division KSB1 bacterium]|nr:MAG: hypothetical protein EH223_05690 [candidate division KSB1 bacterium]